MNNYSDFKTKIQEMELEDITNKVENVIINKEYGTFSPSNKNLMINLKTPFRIYEKNENGEFISEREARLKIDDNGDLVIDKIT